MPRYLVYYSLTTVREVEADTEQEAVASVEAEGDFSGDVHDSDIWAEEGR